MIVELLTEHHLEFLSFKEAAEARPSQIVGNLMHWLKILEVLLIIESVPSIVVSYVTCIVKFRRR